MAPRSHLIVAAHHDDAEFGCGGIIARYGDAEAFHVVVLAHGKLTADDADPREDESVRAFEIHLPVKSRAFLRAFQETTGNLTHLGSLANLVQQCVAIAEPTDLYIPLRGFNQDHDAVHQACLIALRPVGSMVMPLRVWTYEYPGDVWGLGEPPPSSGSRHTALTEEQVDRKCAALREHRSQFAHREGILVGPVGARRLAQYRGAAAGVEYAETHHLIREVVP